MVVGARTGPIVRWGAAVGLGAVWWWAVLRLLLPGDAGVLEGTVAAGGWGLSVLPVHCVQKERPGRRPREPKEPEAPEGLEGAASSPSSPHRSDRESGGASVG